MIRCLFLAMPVIAAPIAALAVLAPAPSAAGEMVMRQPAVAVADAHGRVPLPVARPLRFGDAAIVEAAASPRLIADGAPASGDSSGTVSVPAGNGLKSGSTEALEVQLEGAKVVSAEGDVVGEVERVLDEPGTAQRAVVSIGGFLGIGESRVLIPAETLVPTGKGVVRTDLSEKQLKSLPLFKG